MGMNMLLVCTKTWMDLISKLSSKGSQNQRAYYMIPFIYSSKTDSISSNDLEEVERRFLGCQQYSMS